MVDWIDEHELRRRHSQPGEVVYIAGAGGTKHRVAVIADGYFVLRWRDRKAHFFLEADRATIANKRWMRKVRAYMAYYRSGQYQARYQTRSLRVLTVTTSQKRLANLKAATEQAGGGRDVLVHHVRPGEHRECPERSHLASGGWPRQLRFDRASDSAASFAPIRRAKALTCGRRCGIIFV